MSVSRARRTPRTPQQRRQENLDIFLGILGFFTAVVFVSTASAEVHGEQSLGRAVALAVLVGLVAVTLRIRRGLRP